MDLPSIVDGHVRSNSPWAVPVAKTMLSRPDKVPRAKGLSHGDGQRKPYDDNSARLITGYFPPPIRDTGTPSRRPLLSTQSCPADIEASELRTYSIVNDSRQVESLESLRMRQRKRTGRRERPSLLSRLSEEAKEVMKEIREEMEREKREKEANITAIFESARTHKTTEEISMGNFEDDINIESVGSVDERLHDLERPTSDAKRHKISIVSSTGSATNSLTTESRSTFTDSEREINGSTGDDRTSTPPESVPPGTISRVSLVNDAIIEEEEYALDFNVRRNKFIKVQATPLVRLSTKTRSPRPAKLDQKHPVKFFQNSNGTLYSKRQRLMKRQDYCDISCSQSGEYNETRSYRKTPPIPLHVLKKIKQVEENEAEQNSPPPPPPKPTPRLYKERSFQVTGPGYDIRYHQPLYYNYHPELNPLEKKLQTESVEKCRAWLDKWVISE
ncbi:uncharacterized protein [Ptychodera flava]|uniref:uncharacterized protein n=1 Tax=Ptychodera flava TaxID=63121 RepID=UPI00396A7563